MMRAILLVSALALLAACGAENQPSYGDVPTDTGHEGIDWVDTPSDVPYEPVETLEITDDVDCYQDIDIVFVLDVSTSMTWVLERLASEIEAVWTYAESMSDHVDYDPSFGLVVFVDDVLVTNGSSPYTSAADLREEFNVWRAFCSTEAQPGGSACRNMDCPENTLDALAAAAESYPWRPDALHIAIHVTDDTFKEYPDRLCSSLSPTIPVNHTYAQTIDLLVTSEIRVGTFAVHSSSACPFPPNKDPGFFAPWAGQLSIPDATGSRVWDLTQVQSGAISLTAAISGFVLEEWCTEFI